MPRSASPAAARPARRAPHTAGPASRAAQAHESLRREILAGHLPPGTRLIEVEIASRLGLSRTPVRAALARLESDGLAVNQGHAGLTVTRLDQGMVGELYAIREVLEGTAARLAARHASDIEIDLLRDIARRDIACRGDADKLAANNRLLHQTLYRHAHNRYLLKTLNALQESMVLLGRTALSIPARQRASFEEHQAIIDALAARDADRAEALMRAHVRGAYKGHLALRLDPP
jgi:DNA-binding GntR family transcriptional regulator